MMWLLKVEMDKWINRIRIKVSNIKWSFEVFCPDVLPPISPNYLSKDLNVSMLLFLLS